MLNRSEENDPDASLKKQSNGCLYIVLGVLFLCCIVGILIPAQGPRTAVPILFPDATIHPMGEDAELGDHFYLRVTAAWWDDLLDPATTDAPPDYAYLHLAIKLRNEGDQVQTVRTLSLLDEGGVHYYRSGKVRRLPGNVMLDRLAPEETIEGTMIFAVPRQGKYVLFLHSAAAMKIEPTTRDTAATPGQ